MAIRCLVFRASDTAMIVLFRQADSGHVRSHNRGLPRLVCLIVKIGRVFSLFIGVWTHVAFYLKGVLDG
jgi:hypothetical protein